ncbi:MAG: mechanosensitive ion channel protein MscS [Nitrosopumilales archaeon CG_4_9_14_0_2_um_filter_34_16]|nr:MAG: mechanosensitive ion channel protein MscS [Nitrosopumilales archaeon CG_4_9_14_0_2_um_filter_34_16]
MKFLLILALSFLFVPLVFAQEPIKEIPIGEFQSVTELFDSSFTFQMAFVILIVGNVVIILVHKYFSKWIDSKKIRYTRPHIARFFKMILLPLFVIVLITSINSYVQATDFFTKNTESLNEEITPSKTFTKILNSLTILIIGYTTGHIITIILNKREKLSQEKEYFEAWKELRGFLDDVGDFFHTVCEWIPPKSPPDDMTVEEFENLLKTGKGQHYLQQYRTSKGNTIGIFKQKVSHPFQEWQKSEKDKYEKYYDDCISGNNETSHPLRSGVVPKEIFTIDEWREEKQFNNYDPVIPGAKLAGYAEKKSHDLPKSLNQIIPVAIFFATILVVMSWWNMDILVLGTAVAGFGVGIGFALKETMENFFAYFMIRKDKIFTEGDRVEIDNYNGYIHKITSRVTYVRHALNESIAIFPTRQLIASKVINYSKEMKFVPAIVEVGVSYLNNAKQVAAILTKVGQRAMQEIKDDRNKHIVIQNQCPYIEDNKPSCGCDKDLMIDLKQPKVRFVKFNESSLDFKVWVYVREYSMQFKVESAIRMMIQEEFEKYDIRIPWPIRTIYSGDDKKEASEIAKLEKERQEALNKYGTGDINLK